MMTVRWLRQVLERLRLHRNGNVWLTLPDDEFPIGAITVDKEGNVRLCKDATEISHGETVLYDASTD